MEHTQVKQTGSCMWDFAFVSDSLGMLEHARVDIIKYMHVVFGWG